MINGVFSWFFPHHSLCPLKNPFHQQRFPPWISGKDHSSWTTNVSAVTSTERRPQDLLSTAETDRGTAYKSWGICIRGWISWQLETQKFRVKLCWFTKNKEMYLLCLCSEIHTNLHVSVSLNVYKYTHTPISVLHHRRVSQNYRHWTVKRRYFWGLRYENRERRKRGTIIFKREKKTQAHFRYSFHL